MYRIESITDKLLNDHYNNYKATAQQLMLDLKDGKFTIPGELGRVDKILLTYQVEKGSPTYLFLDKYSQEENLRKLLCGTWDELLTIVEEVKTWIPNLEWQEKATKGKYEAGLYQTSGPDADNRVLIDHFNEILNWLFVQQMYAEHFDKLQFIKSLNLKVCPYCGRQQINIAELDGHNVSKPPIDHFLPKFAYPFLAISFRNLVPCCSVCNELTNKGIHDPLNPEITLENPYVFDDSHIFFKGTFDSENKNDANRYDVDMICNPQALDKGYNKVLKLLPFYQDEKYKIMCMHQNFIRCTETFVDYLDRLGCERDYLRDITCLIVGHPLDVNPSQFEYYKFRKDLFLQLLKAYGFLA